MEQIGIKSLSKAKQMKLIKGGSIRIEKGDIPFMVHSSRLHDIANTFRKSSGHTISLSQKRFITMLIWKEGVCLTPLNQYSRRVSN